MASDKPKIICLMGPTASGKTPLAIEWVKQFPLEIISVDSAMVYRDMNIGTAKPDAETLQQAPHRLIDLIDPSESYSAGQFRDDALREINAVLQQGKVPLLVGGTMLYYKVLQQGIADLPKADANVRAELERKAANLGWEGLHEVLSKVDPLAAKRIHPHDSQRIQRALEVYELTGQTITALQTGMTSPLSHYDVHSFALMPTDRFELHLKIEKRFHAMLASGFIEEVEALYQRGDLSPELPSIRSVGYRQVWEYLAGIDTYEQMCNKAIAATRQLAKRQITWLRSWSNLQLLTPNSTSFFVLNELLSLSK